MHQKRQEYAVAASRRSSLYGFLAAVYKREPNQELVRYLRHPEVLETLQQVGVALDLTELCAGPVETVTERLATEYTRLFIGPGKHVSLNESVYRDGEGLLWGESTSAVKGFIEAVGLALGSDWTGLPDHLSVELELMQRLTQREAEAWSENDCDSVLRCVALEREFMQRHLLQWVPRLCARVLEQNPSSLYRQISQLMQGLINFDGSYISDLIGNVLAYHDTKTSIKVEC